MKICEFRVFTANVRTSSPIKKKKIELAMAKVTFLFLPLMKKKQREQLFDLR